VNVDRGVLAAQDAAARAGQPMFIRPLTPGEVAAFAGRGCQGALAGVPVAVKDNLDLAGLPTTAGCPLLAKGPGAADSAVAVHQLLDAGAVPVA